MTGRTGIAFLGFGFFAILSVPDAATAAPALKCHDPQTQMEINLCAAEDARKADAELNRQWSATAAVMHAQDKAGYAPRDGRPGYYAALLEAQRAWIRFRDLECRAQGYAMRGGSAEPMMISGCLAEVTRARTKQLKDMAANYRH
ncbi:lysozyme inhibitor LprI family protein [Sphingobium nicotianae]|uniref:DUF1311 domain-containing protein n=1 Tax=Sphingobium nicotianae TaxID=2782607 RepID=A0A9X1DD18_9SPHN|nr:lysozyme inhibitor LprI family protein [Sphingobium nicotianae]MBT2187659.1 DUF1311 domain-containing protein [Sphingobium nicotianae]